MSQFERAIPILLDHEGGFVDDTDDKGGPTNFGISLRYLQALAKTNPDLADINHDGVIDRADILALTQEHASQIYRIDWWDKVGYDKLESQSIGTKVFDLAVNMGAHQAHKLLQRACRQVLVDEQVLVVDGVLGQRTLHVSNCLKSSKLLDALRTEAVAFYISLHNPKQTAGWLKRARD